MAVEHVSGKDTGHIMLYALSTCSWCRKTKNFLNDLGVEYYTLDVDLLKDDERDSAVETVKQWNPSCSFPTMVINDKKCIVGFKENEIRSDLKL